MWIDSLFANFLDFGRTQRVLFLSFISMLPLAVYLSRKFSVSWLKFLFLTAISLYMSYVFGRIFHVFLDAKSIARDFFSFSVAAKFRLIFHPYAGGIMFYGSLIGSLIGMFPGYFLFRGQKASFLKCFDVTIVCFAFTAIFSRIADFNSGESFGFPVRKWGLVYPPDSAPARQLAAKGIIQPGEFTPPLFPAQPIMVFAMILIFFTLLFKVMFSRQKIPLEYVAFYFLMYCPYRFLIDFLRFDRAAYFLGLTTSQWLSVVFLIVAVIYYRKIYPRLKASETETL